MNTLSYKTVSANQDTVSRKWYIVDAEGEVVGRLSSHVAAILRGKHKPDYTPHTDNGDYVIIVNAEKVHFSGKKWDQKEYITYSGYPGGQKRRVAKEVLVKKPEMIIENAIKGMLPKTKLGRAQVKKLFVYSGPDHPHQAQKPEPISFKK